MPPKRGRGRPPSHHTDDPVILQRRQRQADLARQSYHRRKAAHAVRTQVTVEQLQQGEFIVDFAFTHEDAALTPTQLPPDVKLAQDPKNARLQCDAVEADEHEVLYQGQEQDQYQGQEQDQQQDQQQDQDDDYNYDSDYYHITTPTLQRHIHSTHLRSSSVNEQEDQDQIQGQDQDQVQDLDHFLDAYYDSNSGPSLDPDVARMIEIFSKQPVRNSHLPVVADDEILDEVSPGPSPDNGHQMDDQGIDDGHDSAEDSEDSDNTEGIPYD